MEHSAASAVIEQQKTAIVALRAEVDEVKVTLEVAQTAAGKPSAAPSSSGITDLTSLYPELKVYMDSIAARVEAEEGLRARLTSEMTKLMNDVTSLTAASGAAMAAEAEAQTRLSELHAENSKLKAKVTEHAATIEQRDVSLAKLGTELAATIGKAANLDQSLEASKSMVLSLQRQLALAEETLARRGDLLAKVNESLGEN